MIVSIHQPNLFPWHPFFQKMDASDIFVLLTHCQFEKGGYQNRFNADENWHTMSVESGLIPIRNKKYKNPYSDWKRIKTNLPQYGHILNQYDHHISCYLNETNSAIIRQIAFELNIITPIVQDCYTSLTGTERLVQICMGLGATRYLSGLSGKKYLDESLFKVAGIEVIYQDETKMRKKPIIEVLYERDRRNIEGHRPHRDS